MRDPFNFRSSSRQKVRVFVTGLEQHWQVRIGLRPRGEESLVRGHAVVQVSCRRRGACEGERRDRVEWRERIGAAVIQDQLELFRGLPRLSEHQIRLASEVNRGKGGDEPQLVRGHHLQVFDAHVRAARARWQCPP